MYTPAYLSLNKYYGINQKYNNKLTFQSSFDFEREIRNKLNKDDSYRGTKKQKAEELITHLKNPKNRQELERFMDSSSRAIRNRHLTREAKNEARRVGLNDGSLRLFHGANSRKDHESIVKNGIDTKKLGDDSFGGFSLGTDEGIARLYSYDSRSAIEFKPRCDNAVPLRDALRTFSEAADRDLTPETRRKIDSFRINLFNHASRQAGVDAYLPQEWPDEVVLVNPDAAKIIEND